MPRYVIISGGDPCPVAAEVTVALNDGGTLHGDLKIIQDAHGVLFFQAVLFP